MCPKNEKKQTNQRERESVFIHTRLNMHVKQ